MHKHGLYQLRDSHVPCSPFQPWGKFGRLFPTLPPHEADEQDLVALGVKGGPMDEGQSDPPADDSQTIPAGFTFLGQFIDHDITFDPTSSLERQNDPTAIRNFRTPLLELDAVYGAGPGANPHLYDRDDPDKLLVGTSENPDDLPRNRQGTALVGDPRNDENLIISQLQLAFLKLHNAVVDHLRDSGMQPKKVFGEAQRLVRWHYQWIVVHEFLPLIIGQHMVDEILQDGPNYFHPGLKPFMPVEFSVAAYRFGHSQVRAVYQVNPETTKELFDLPFFAPIPPHQLVDWSNFFHVSSSNPPQFSRKIDAKLASTLLDLPVPIVPPGLPAERRSLAVRNLLRGAAFNLPSGQSVAKAMGIEPLPDEELGLADRPEFKGQAPLWFYILKEAEVQSEGETLGQVGGRLVGEVLLGLLKADPMSYLNLEPRWQPDPTIAPKGEIVDLLRFAGVIPASSPAISDPEPSPTTAKTVAELDTFANAKPIASPAVITEPTPAPVATKQRSGQPRLQELEVMLDDGGAPHNLLREGQPFNVRLTLDMTETPVSDRTPLSYTATTYAKRLGGGSRQIIGEVYDTITTTDKFVITMAGKPLPTGLYRLETAVTLTFLPDGPDLTTLLEGTLLQVQ